MKKNTLENKQQLDDGSSWKVNELRESLEFHEERMKHCKTQKEFDRHRERTSELMCEISALK